MKKVLTAAAISTSIAALSAASALAASTGPDDPAYRVSVHLDEPAALLDDLENLGIASDCDVVAEGSDLEMILSENGLAELRRRGLEPIILERARPFAEIAAERAAANPEDPQAYLTYPQIVDWMNDVASEYPAIAEVVDVNAMLGTALTHEGRRLYAMRISDNVQATEDEPTMLLVSCHHAREIVTPVLAMDAITRLTETYGTDPRVTAAVDGNEIWIIPVQNPDGYEYVWSSSNMWRKNRRNNGGNYGVDLNRNYPQGWSTICAGSTTTSSNTYKGPSPASEPVTQTLMALSLDQRFAKVLDYHSYGRETLYGYKCSSHPFQSFWADEAKALSTASGYGGSSRVPGAEGEQQQWQFATLGSNAYLTETHTQFQPSYSSAVEEANKLWPGVLQMLERPISVSGTVVSASSGLPVEASVSLVGMNFPNGESNSSGGELGHYQWTLPAGNYTLEFAASGYQTQQVPVTVTANSAERLDIYMASEAMFLTLVNGPMGLVAPAVEPVVEVDIVAGSQQIVPGSEKIFYREAGGSFSTIALTPSGGTAYSAALPLTVCGADPEYYVEAKGDGGETMRLPAGAPTVVYAYDVGELSTSAIASEDFENGLPAGWSATGLWNITSLCSPATPCSGNSWAYFGKTSSCTYSTGSRATGSLTSPTISVPAFNPTGGAKLTYCYNFERENNAQYDFARVFINGNLVDEPTPTNTWDTREIDLAGYAGQDIQVAFLFDSTDGFSNNYRGFQVDGVKVEVTDSSCGGCPCACNVDTSTGLGVCDIFDFLGFQNAFVGADPCACDIDLSTGLGVCDIFDFLAFQNEFVAGCP